MKAEVKPLPAQDAKKFIEDLGGESEPLSDAMRMLDVVDLRDGEDITIILRTMTEPFLQECIKQTDSCRVAAIGNPGIGKSITAFYLMKLILESRACTLGYKNCSKTNAGFYYEFISSRVSAPGNGPEFTVDISQLGSVAVIQELTNAEDIASLKERDNFYLIDPGRTTDSCNPDDVVTARVIMVPSHDP
jgi:hypothetical protein